MSHGHDFDGIRDQLPAGQGILHALMVHGDPVADADGAKFDRCASGQAHPGLNGFGDFIQVDMARE